MQLVVHVPSDRTRREVPHNLHPQRRRDVAGGRARLQNLRSLTLPQDGDRRETGKQYQREEQNGFHVMGSVMSSITVLQKSLIKRNMQPPVAICRTRGDRQV